MTVGCVCSHPQHHHLNDTRCLHVTHCGCETYMADDDTCPTTLGHGSYEPYYGRYARACWTIADTEEDDL